MSTVRDGHLAAWSGEAGFGLRRTATASATGYNTCPVAANAANPAIEAGVSSRRARRALLKRLGVDADTSVVMRLVRSVAVAAGLFALAAVIPSFGSHGVASATASTHLGVYTGPAATSATDSWSSWLGSPVEY